MKAFYCLKEDTQASCTHSDEWFHRKCGNKSVDDTNLYPLWDGDDIAITVLYVNVLILITNDE